MKLTKAKADLLAYSADKRWRTEIAPITVNGKPVQTDDRSKILINQSFAMARADRQYTKQWKLNDGQYIALDNRQLLAMGESLERWSVICYEKERDIATRIQSGELKDTMAIDAIYNAINRDLTVNPITGAPTV